MSDLPVSVRFAAVEWSTPLFCFFCGRELLHPYDYSCAECGRLTCDNDQEICQNMECDYPVTCHKCMEAHHLTCGI